MPLSSTQSAREFFDMYKSIPHIAEVIKWVEEDLKRSLDDITDFSISCDTVREASDTRWKRFNALNTGVVAVAFHTDDSRKLESDIVHLSSVINRLKYILAGPSFTRDDEDCIRELQSIKTNLINRLPVYDKHIQFREAHSC